LFCRLLCMDGWSMAYEQRCVHRRPDSHDVEEPAERRRSLLRDNLLNEVFVESGG